MRHTRSATRERRSHHALKTRATSLCPHCGKAILPHTLCMNCGYFRGRQVIDVLGKLDKKERRKKEKELHEHESQTAAKGKNLSAEELSHA